MDRIDSIPDRLKAICDIEAEEAVLGGMLESRDAVPKVINILGTNPKVFYKAAHQVIYDAIIKLFDNNEPVDPITVATELKKRNQLNLIGGAIYLWDLLNSVPTAANVEHYAEIVREKALRRALIAAGREIIQLAHDEEAPINEVLDEAEQKIFDVSHSRTTRTFASIKETIKDSIARIEKLYSSDHHIIGVPTGFWEFDSLTSGLQPSELIIIAARPSVGKSALAHNIAQYVAVQFGKPVAIFSLEMPKEDVTLRMLAAEAKIDFHKLRTGSLTDEEWMMLTHAAGRLEMAPIFIDDTPGLNILELKALSRRLKAEHPDLSLIVVDYIQLMVAGRKMEGRQQEIAEISRSLKELARELEVPVLALSQLNRAIESRADHRPQLSDLRESGSLEQDADLVAFIHREDYYEDAPTDQSDAELIIKKNRNGPQGIVRLKFIKRQMRFISDPSRKPMPGVL